MYVIHNMVQKHFSISNAPERSRVVSLVSYKVKKQTFQNIKGNSSAILFSATGNSGGPLKGNLNRRTFFQQLSFVTREYLGMK
jgi:hypothetical protein